MASTAQVQRLLDSGCHDELCRIMWPAGNTNAQVPYYVQGFAVSDKPSPEGQCFFQQRQNGPCGILAGMQALMLQELMWPSDGSAPAVPKTASSLQVTTAFARAIATSLFQASASGEVCLVVRTQGMEPIDPQQQQKQQPTYPDLAQYFYHTFRPAVLKFSDMAAACQAVSQHLFEFVSPSGVVQYVFSLLLTRGPDLVRASMRGTPSLVYPDATCDQLLVNLIITGFPCDDIHEEAWAQWEGVNRVGFIPEQRLFVPAARFLSPMYPVWVCHSGGHYTVLFCANEHVLQAYPLPMGTGPLSFGAKAKSQSVAASTQSTVRIQQQQQQQSKSTLAHPAFSKPQGPYQPQVESTQFPTQARVHDADCASSPTRSSLVGIAQRLDHLPAARRPSSQASPSCRDCRDASAHNDDNNNRIIDEEGQELMAALRLSLQTPSALKQNSEKRSPKAHVTEDDGSNPKRHCPLGHTAAAQLDDAKQQIAKMEEEQHAAPSSPLRWSNGSLKEQSDSETLSDSHSTHPPDTSSDAGSASHVHSSGSGVRERLSLSSLLHATAVTSRAASTAASSSSTGPVATSTAPPPAVKRDSRQTAAVTSNNDDRNNNSSCMNPPSLKPPAVATCDDDDDDGDDGYEPIGDEPIGADAVDDMENQLLQQAIEESRRTYEQEQSGQGTSPTGAGVHYTMFLYNGLNSGDPNNTLRVSRFEVYPLGGLTDGVSNPASRQAENHQRKIKDIIACQPVAQGSRVLKFLVVCERDGSMENQNARPPANVKWRCRDCHLKDPPIFAAYNEPGTEICRECERHVAMCGFCHWLWEEQIPLSILRSFFHMNMPILGILSRRFPNVEVSFPESIAPSMHG